MSERANKHTPGPWEAAYGHVRGPHRVPVAYCGAASSSTADGSYLIKPWESEHNAILCAAAPELLNALENLAGVVNGGGGAQPDALTKAREAIDKAYG